MRCRLLETRRRYPMPTQATAEFRYALETDAMPVSQFVALSVRN